MKPESLEELLKRHEGVRQFVYDDATGKPVVAGYTLVGNPTIGVGRNLAGKGLSDKEVDSLCWTDLCECYGDVVSWLDDGIKTGSICETRFNALCSLAMIGPTRLAGFIKLREAVLDSDWIRASEELLLSRYARQLPERAEELAQMLLLGCDYYD